MKEDIVGKVFTTNKSGDCVVTKYVRYDEIHIKFLKTGFERTTSLDSLKSGKVKDKTLIRGGIKNGIITREDIEDLFEFVGNELYWKESVSGKRAGKPVANKYNVVSIMGKVYRFKDVLELFKGDKEDISPNVKPTKNAYSVWNAMQKRCKQNNIPISDIFSKYETWISWAKYQKGFGELDMFNNKFQLDSDMFSNGNKTYSEDTCVFIPEILNQIYKTSFMGNEYIGVSLHRGKYRARISMFNRYVIIGNFTGKDEALRAYRSKRAEYLYILLNIYRDKLSDKVIKFIENDISGYC